MSEKPILFSGPMVNAILSGRKTQTRRVIKPPLGPKAEWMRREGLCWMANGLLGDIPRIWWSKILYPKYDPGDRLWVRETWQPFIRSMRSGIRYKAGGEKNTLGDDFNSLCELLKRTGGDLQYKYGDWGDPSPSEVRYRDDWRPSIHMPRWASRLTLEVTGVRVERLQEIGAADCVAEGLHPTMRNETPVKNRFQELWDSINGKTHPWESNPWVWVYEFRRVET